MPNRSMPVSESSANSLPKPHKGNYRCRHPDLGIVANQVFQSWQRKNTVAYAAGPENKAARRHSTGNCSGRYSTDTGRWTSTEAGRKHISLLHA